MDMWNGVGNGVYNPNWRERWGGGGGSVCVSWMFGVDRSPPQEVHVSITACEGCHLCGEC